jgi:hypothetical protein
MCEVCFKHLNKVKYAYQECPHPLDTASQHSQKVEEKRAWLYNNQFHNRRHKHLTKVRIRRVTAMERSVDWKVAELYLEKDICGRQTESPFKRHQETSLQSQESDRWNGDRSPISVYDLGPSLLISSISSQTVWIHDICNGNYWLLSCFRMYFIASHLQHATSGP